MIKFLSFLINILIVLFLFSLYFINYFIFLPLFLSYIIFSLSFSLYFLYKKSNKNLFLLSIIFFIILISLLYKSDISIKARINYFFYKFTNIDKKKNIDVNLLINNLENKIKNKNYSEEEIKREIVDLINLSNKLLSEKDPKTYYDLGRIYDIAYLFGIDKSDSFAVKSYKKYCDLKYKDLNKNDTIKNANNFLLGSEDLKKDSICNLFY